MDDPTAKSRLSIWQAAFVIARRDFAAILFSRAFLFFLLGPLFPIVVGGLAGGIGSQVQQQTSTSEIGVALSAGETRQLLAAREALVESLGPALPELARLEDVTSAEDAKAYLEARRGNYAAILTGSLAEPMLTGPRAQVDTWRGRIALLASTARAETPVSLPEIATQTVATSGASQRSDRVRTAQAGQVLLFLLIMLLAGMVLSNLVEEKGNKIIEVLAAAIPMDAVFLGKLFAMLGVSFVGITVWGLTGAAVMGFGGYQAQALTEPAVGWPLFFLFGMLYFAMGYLLLGSLFLAIGSMAKTVREVQTLSMPVTMLQLLVFFLASYAMARPGSTVELVAAIFPLSSPFAMLARAAQLEAIWPHLLALAWQAFAVAIFVKAGAALFRRRVMQSGPNSKRRRWRRGKARAA